MMEMTYQMIVGVVVLAFFCEYMDATLGMGYGTTMTPVLLLLGFSPMQIVPCILLSELVTGVLGGVFHHKEGNVNFHFKFLNFQRIKQSVMIPGVTDNEHHTYAIQISQHTKVVMLLLAATLVGATSSVLTAKILPKQWTSLYISVMVISMGILILVFFNKKLRYAWQKIVGLGFLASFNKGLTGGGYGPLVVSGQVLSGIEGKNAIGITSLAEGLTCALGVISYVVIAKGLIDWRLAPYIIGGAICSVPLSAKSVKFIPPKILKIVIAVLTIALGVLTLVKTLKSF